MATQNFYIPTSERKNNHGPNSLIYPNHYDNPIYRNILNPKLLTTKNPIKLNFKSKPTIHLNQNHHLKLQMNNFDKFKPFPVAMGINKFFPTTTMTTTRTTTGKFYPPTLTPKYVPKEELDYDDDYSETMTTTTTTTKRPYFTTSRRSVSGSSKYSPQIATDYNANDYSYANQRYASGVTNVTWQQPAVATATPVEEEDDESYYVYEDAAGNQQDVDVDYKYQHPITTRRPITTPAPAPPPTRRTTTTPPKQKSRTSPPTRSRPTLKPKSSIVPKDLPPVRDVYLDAPSRPAPFYETPIPNTPATKCNRELCQIPDCNCGGKEIPSGLRPEETPQIVLLTFDDSVNDLNKNLYRDLFEKGRKNPNGCPISATFYVSHEWTDYSQVQNLAADGHEIASHSVSHSFGESFSQKKWEKEINGQREILSAYGGVKLSEVRGMRAPFLAIGGNNMFKMLHDVNFTYDSSMPVYENRPPSWPYTLDYKIFHDCMIPPCPTKSYPGVWEVPMVMWTDLKGGRCSMGDACSNPPTAEGVYQFLAKNFERHYTTNRAPFGLYYHAAWFTQAHHKEGFEAFLDTLVQMDDVWLVTNWQAIQWVRNPTPSSKINEFAPWNECRTREHRPPRCNHSRVCNLWHKSGVRYLKTCQNCPEQYPWTGNTGVPFTI